MNKKYLSWVDIYREIKKLDCTKRFYGIPKGGAIVAGLTGNAVDTPEEADIIIDDLLDSGRTAERYKYLNKPMVFLYNKKIDDTIKNTWLVFPWEAKDTTKDLDDHIVRILEHFGSDEILEGVFKEYVKEFFKPK